MYGMILAVQSSYAEMHIHFLSSSDINSEVEMDFFNKACMIISV
jgi:hypothetical protein